MSDVACRLIKTDPTLCDCCCCSSDIEADEGNCASPKQAGKDCHHAQALRVQAAQGGLQWAYVKIEEGNGRRIYRS